jgi:CheY-like chemotaxis protein
VTPPQILAIEPDRWRASQLKTIARRIGAELRLTDSMDGALAALNEQTPDLILTPALLSARDDQALTDRLRRLGEAAAHIQTVTIPTLHTPEPSGGELSLSSTRMFAALRKDRSHATGPEACDTDTFAEQVAFYLMGATEARRKRAPTAVSSELPPKPSEAAPRTAEHVDDGSASLVTVPAGPGSGGARRLEGPPKNLTQIEGVQAFKTSSQAVASVAVDPSFDELDLTACISDDLLDQTPVYSIGAPARAEGGTTIEAELEAALSRALADATAEEFQDFLPEDLTAVPAPASEESPLSEFDSEGPAPSPVTADLNGWQLLDPAKPRFAALLAKLDEIAMRSA